jgi:hypothetical protein
MKKLFLTLTAIAGLTLLGLTGCDHCGSGEPAIDTSKVQSAFAAASPVDKAEVEQALTAVKAGDYAGALTSLKAAAASVKLTPEQQQSLKDLVAQVQTKLGAAATEAMDKAKAAASEAAKQAGEAANKAAGDLQKAVGK